MAGTSPAMTAEGEGKFKSAKSVLREGPEQGVHRNVWGFVDLTLDSPRWPPHIGTAAGKTRRGDGGGRFPAQAVGRRSDFGLFAVREMNGCDGRVRSCAPRVVLRFEGSKNEIGTKFPE